MEKQYKEEKVQTLDEPRCPNGCKGPKEFCSECPDERCEYYKNKNIEKTDIGEFVDVKEGTHLKMNGVEYVFDKGSLVPIEKKTTENPHFYVWFDKNQVEWGRQTSTPKKIQGLDVVVKNKLVGIDIYPLVKELFAAPNYIGLYAFRGVQSQSENREDGSPYRVPETSLSFTGKESARLIDKINDMFNMSVVNRNQLESYKRHVDSIFSDFFKDFWSME